MIQVTLFTLIGIACLVIAVILAYWPSRGRHERTPDDWDDWLPTTLAPLPAPELLSAPRACPDTPHADDLVSAALRAAQHPCYQYAARLAAMSWQSHKTLQRNYDVMAFATVASSYYRMGSCYAG